MSTQVKSIQSNKSEVETQLFEECLCKFTNVVKGWQSRYFVLDCAAQRLSYYLAEEDKNRKPRGSISLVNATVGSKDDDTLAFTITSLDGVCYELKASDMKQKQEWINRLSLAVARACQKSTSQNCGVSINQSTAATAVSSRKCFADVQRMLYTAAEQQKAIGQGIDSLDTNSCVISDLLLLKATSQSLLLNLECCAEMLKHSSGLNPADLM